MNKLFSKFSELIEKVVPVLNAISSKPFVKAMQTGMTAPMVATVIGSIFIVMRTPPASPDSTNAIIVAWRVWADANVTWLNLGQQLTINAIGVYALVGFVIDYAISRKAKPINMLILAMIVFFALSTDIVEGRMTLDFWGARGLFPAIIIGFAVVRFGSFLLEKGVKINLPSTVPPNVAEPIQALFMNGIVIAIAFVIRIFLDSQNIMLPGLVNDIFSPLFIAGDTIYAVILSMFLIRILWFFGLHGGNIAGVVMTPFLTATMAANIEAFGRGEELPFIFTLVFNQTWGVIGMLAICIAVMICCKSKQLKAVSKIGFVPALFNIGEPITFGLPIVLNFKIIVPYLIMFSMNGAVAYAATYYGFMNRTFINLPTTIPAIVRVFLQNMDWRSIVVYLLLMVANVAVSIPFLKKYDNELLEKERAE